MRAPEGGAANAALKRQRTSRHGNQKDLLESAANRTWYVAGSNASRHGICARIRHNIELYGFRDGQLLVEQYDGDGHHASAVCLEHAKSAIKVFVGRLSCGNTFGCKGRFTPLQHARH
jgi:hypothetical protein